jgi:hypothetical protein
MLTHEQYNKLYEVLITYNNDDFARFLNQGTHLPEYWVELKRIADELTNVFHHEYNCNDVDYAGIYESELKVPSMKIDIAVADNELIDINYKIKKELDNKNVTNRDRERDRDKERILEAGEISDNDDDYNDDDDYRYTDNYLTQLIKQRNTIKDYVDNLKYALNVLRRKHPYIFKDDSTDPDRPVEEDFNNL